LSDRFSCVSIRLVISVETEIKYAQHIPSPRLPNPRICCQVLGPDSKSKKVSDALQKNLISKSYQLLHNDIELRVVAKFTNRARNILQSCAKYPTVYNQLGCRSVKSTKDLPNRPGIKIYEQTKVSIRSSVDEYNKTQ
jgi:hypothetical protein